MINVLHLESLDATERDRLLNRSSALDREIQTSVAEILSEVKTNGDAALREFSRLFDSVRLERLDVPCAQIQKAFDAISPELQAALGKAKVQLERFHEKQRLSGYELEISPGVQLGQQIKAFSRVGIYVPKNLVSSLLMAAVPARLASVCELVVCTPPQAYGTVAQAIQAVAGLLGVDELYAVGGAHAIAAMAYGTESIAKVEKIVGPGNAYVTAAKALVRDEVGIDLLAGPSEVLLIIEPVEGVSEERLSQWALAELRAQLEHGPGTSALLLSSLPRVTQTVAQNLREDELEDRNVAVLAYGDLKAALKFANDYAPEHLCLWGETAERQFPYVDNAGSIFLGPWSPVALGDYTSGTNHILPTARQARFGSGLGVCDFVKKISYQRISEQGLKDLAPTVTTLAQLEGMDAHADSVNVRLEGSS